MATVIRDWYDPAPAGVVFTASLLLGDLAARVVRLSSQSYHGRFHSTVRTIVKKAPPTSHMTSVSDWTKP